MRRFLHDWWLRVTRRATPPLVADRSGWYCITACAPGICPSDDMHDPGCVTPGRSFLSVAAGVWDCARCGTPTPLTHQSTFCKVTGESDVTVHWCCPNACQLDDPQFRRERDERRERETTLDPDVEVPF